MTLTGFRMHTYLDALQEFVIQIIQLLVNETLLVLYARDFIITNMLSIIWVIGTLNVPLLGIGMAHNHFQ